jgi:hypothetical protein
LGKNIPGKTDVEYAQVPWASRCQPEEASQTWEASLFGVNRSTRDHKLMRIVSLGFSLGRVAFFLVMSAID